MSAGRENATDGSQAAAVYADPGPDAGAAFALEPTPVAEGSGDPRGTMVQTIGRIARIEGPTLVVIPEEGSPFSPEVRARRALSCLIEPELNDRVLVSGDVRGGDRTFVLAVLEREGPDASIALAGDLDIRLKDGRFRVAAQKGVDLVSPESVDLVANRVAVHANAARLVASEVVALASQVVAELTNIQLEGAVLDKVFERVSERVQRSLRSVEELDQVKAKHIDYEADESLSLRGAKTVISRDESTDLDDDLIHYG